MKNSSESIHVMKVTLLIRTLVICLVVFACCLIALPGSAVGPAGDAQKAYDDWVAANEAVKAAKENLAKAKDKQNRVMANTASGGITEGEQRALDKARDEVAEAEAALKDAEAKLLAARIELEKAIAELEDEKLKKELIRKRDGYIAAQRFTAIAPAKASLETKSGLHTTTFDTSHGRVIVNLPDDMRAGDTISGTVVVEPKGGTEEERKNNAAKLSELKLNFGAKLPRDQKDFVLSIKPQFYMGYFTIPLPESFDYTITVDAPRTNLQTVTITVNSPIWFIRDQANTPRPEPPVSADNFRLPEMGQQGRAVEIFGPFDGNASNTTLRFGPPTSTVKDFEKGTENVSGGFGLIRPLAESPRKLVFESPANVTGPVQLMLQEGDAKTLAPYRNVGVRLSAPKTNLLRGERTTLTVEVTGLEGIQKEVPLQLDAKGVITMDGGNFQNLRITPAEINPAGTYTTTRAITGQQAGAFTVTATVIVGRYDMKLQDDVEPARRFVWNTFTGDYFFTTGGAPLRPGGQPPSGGTTSPGGAPKPPMGGTSLSGTGKPAMKGCIITLNHNAPDRRVFARLDVCNKSGDASVQSTSPKTNFTLTDKNTTDNTSGPD